MHAERQGTVDDFISKRKIQFISVFELVGAALNAVKNRIGGYHLLKQFLYLGGFQSEL